MIGYGPLVWIFSVKPIIVSSIVEALNLDCKFFAVNRSEKWYAPSLQLLHFVSLRVFILIPFIELIWAQLEPFKKRNNLYSFSRKLGVRC